jgi:hypothetical protein
LDVLECSIHGHEQTYELLMRNGKFERVRENVIRFRRLRDELGARTRLVVSAVDQPGFQHEKEAHRAFWSQYADEVIYRPHHSWGNRVDGVCGAMPEVRHACSQLWTRCTVGPTGKVLACFNSWSEIDEEILGDLTNGSRLKQWAELLSKMVAYVRVSVDGPTHVSHARIHRSKDFDLILHGVELLVKARGEQRHPIIGLSFAIDIHTVTLAAEAIRLGERLQVDYVLLRPPFFEEVGWQPTMTLEEAQQVRRRLREVARGYGGALDVIVGNGWAMPSNQQGVPSRWRPLAVAICIWQLGLS